MASLSTSTSSSSSTSTGKRSATVAHLDFINIIPTPYDIILPLSSNHKGTTDFKEHVNKLIENVNENDTRKVVLLSYVNSLRNQRYNFVERVDGRYCSRGDNYVLKICEAYYYNISEVKRIRHDNEYDGLVNRQLPNATVAAAKPDDKYDVFLGRGVNNYEHKYPGSIRYRMYIEHNKSNFEAADSKRKKDNIIESIVNMLMFDELRCFYLSVKNNGWKLMDKNEAINKADRTMRDLIYRNKKNMNKEGEYRKPPDEDDDDDDDDDNDGDDDHRDRDTKQKKMELNSKRTPSGSSTRADTTNGNITRQASDCLYSNLADLAIQQNFKKLTLSDSSDNYKFGQEQISKEVLSYFTQQIRLYWLCVEHDCMDCSDLAFIKSSQSDMIRSKLKAINVEDIFEGHAASKAIAHSLVFTDDEIDCLLNLYSRFLDRITAIDVKTITCQPTEKISTANVMDEDNCDNKCNDGMSVSSTVEDDNQDENQTTSSISNASESSFSYVCVRPPTDGDMAMAVGNHHKDYGRNDPSTETLNPEIRMKIGGSGTGNTTDTPIDECIDTDSIFATGPGSDLYTPIDECIDTDSIFATGTGSFFSMHNSFSVWNPNLSTMFNNRSEEDFFSFNIRSRSSNQDKTNTQHDHTDIVQQVIQSKPRLCDVTFPVNGHTFFKDMVNLFYDISKSNKSKEENEKRKQDILYRRVWEIKIRENSRFLEYNPKGDKWYELSDREIFQKFNDWFEFDRFEDDSFSFDNHIPSCNQDTTKTHTDDLNGNLQPLIRELSYHSLGKGLRDELVKEKMDDASLSSIDTI